MTSAKPVGTGCFLYCLRLLPTAAQYNLPPIQPDGETNGLVLRTFQQGRAKKQRD